MKFILHSHQNCRYARKLSCKEETLLYASSVAVMKMMMKRGTNTHLYRDLQSPPLWALCEDKIALRECSDSLQLQPALSLHHTACATR